MERRPLIRLPVDRPRPPHCSPTWLFPGWGPLGWEMGEVSWGRTQMEAFAVDQRHVLPGPILAKKSLQISLKDIEGWLCLNQNDLFFNLLTKMNCNKNSEEFRRVANRCNAICPCIGSISYSSDLIYANFEMIAMKLRGDLVPEMPLKSGNPVSWLFSLHSDKPR